MKNIFQKKNVAAPQRDTKCEKDTTVKKEQENPVDESKAFINLMPVNKPFYLKSKKPLKRIPIKFVDDPLAENLSKPSSELPPTNPVFKEVEGKELDKQEKLKRSLFTISDEHSKTSDKQISEKIQTNLISMQNELESKPAEPAKKGPDAHQKDFKYAYPVTKKAHLRSKKPLLRIPITFV